MTRQPDLFAEPRPTIDELHAQHGPTFGLKQFDKLDALRNTSHDEALAARHERELRHARECADRAILAEYAALGLDPVLASDGTLVSPALLRSIDRLPAPPVQNAEDMR